MALESACACHALADSVVTRCLLTNEVGLAPVSIRVVTESEVGLLPVVMQHVRYMVSISVSSQLHVMCNRESVGRVLPPYPLLPRRCLSTWSEKRVVLNLLYLSAGPYLESCLEESRGWDAAAGWCRNSTGCRAPLPLATLMASAAL